MPKKILVNVAWPYCSGDMHIGGANLPAGIFARSHRLRGDGVLRVSSSGTNGTPITARAAVDNCVAPEPQ